MKRSTIYILSTIVFLAINSSSWAFTGGSHGSFATVPPTKADPDLIFGLKPWESRDSVLAKNLATGIERIEIEEDYATFKDLVVRDVPAQQPREVKYYFISGSLSRITVTYIGHSQPHDLYGRSFVSRYGKPTSHVPGGVTETTWEKGRFYLILSSNHKEQMERQLAVGKRDPEKVKVTIDVIFYPHPVDK